MKSILIILMLAFSPQFAAAEKRPGGMMSLPGANDLVLALCRHKHKRSPALVGACQTAQFAAISTIEGYTWDNWRDVPAGHPVIEIMMQAAIKSKVNIGGTRWVDFTLMEIYFKQGMFNWMDKEGIPYGVLAWL